MVTLAATLSIGVGILDPVTTISMGSFVLVSVEVPAGGSVSAASPGKEVS
jgi:hypothetical protein